MKLKITTITVAVCLLIVCSAGCGQSKSSDNVPSKQPVSATPVGNTPGKTDDTLNDSTEPQPDTANFYGIVTSRTDNGVTATPNIIEDNGATVVAPAEADEDDPSNINIIYDEETKFYIYEINATTHTGGFTDASSDEIKIDSSINGWGVYEGNTFYAKQIAVIRLK